MASSENQEKHYAFDPSIKGLMTGVEIENKLEQAVQYYKGSKYKETIDICLEILNQDKENFFANKFIAATFLKMNKWEDSMVFFKNNLVLNPENIDCYLDLSFALLNNPFKKRSLFLEAIEILKIGLRCKPNNPALVLRMYHAYARLDNLNESELWFDKALILLPDNLSIRFEKAKSIKALGEFEKARSLFRELIKIKPNYAQAIYELFFIKEFQVVDEEIVHAESLLNDPSMNQYDRQCLSFALFNAYDKLGDYQKAFKFLKSGNEIAKSSNPQLKKVDISVMSLFEKVFTKEYIEKRASEINYDKGQYPVPIFVVSMPRSGSTLVEKILSSHSNISSAGEPLFLKQVFEDVRCDISKADPMMLSSKELSKKAVQYLELLSEYSENGTKYIVDKLPLNFIFIGLIKIMFPQAKIVYLDRDPVAVGFSCYKHMFSDGQYFSFDLDDIVEYYSAHKNLKKFWDETVQPGAYLDIQYSVLVDDSELMIRKLIEYCGLVWEDDCLKFYETKAVVLSASLAQVRKPIYKDSNEAWKNYESFLGDFVTKLMSLRAVAKQSPDILP